MALLACLVVSLALSLAGLGYAVVRGISLWRATKRTGRAFAPALGRIAAAGAEIESQVQRAQAAAERLRDATAELQRSRARLQVQVGAASGAVAQVKRMLWFVPGA